jgi:hypothetical protein
MDPTAPEKNDFRHNPQHIGWPIHISATQFLSPSNHWNSNESQAYGDEQATSVDWADISSMWSVRSILTPGNQPIGP